MAESIIKAGAQAALTFDAAPTANSQNPVTSAGIKTALDGKQNALTFGTNFVTIDYSINSNSNFNVNLKPIIDNAKPSGSTVLGVVGYSTNSQYVHPYSLRYANSEYSLELKNITNSTQTNNVRVYYLYMQ